MTTLASSVGHPRPQSDLDASQSNGGCLLATLQPLRVVPHEFSMRTRVVVALRRIEFLGVGLADTGTSTYRIQVYHKPPHHHIPLTDYTNGGNLTTHPRWMTKESIGRSPDLVVERGLPDMTKLHEELFQLARTGLGLEPCAFCLGVIKYCGYGRVKPHRSMAWLHSTESVCDKLSTYLNDLLDLVLKVKAFHPDGCLGQESIPAVFQRFLQTKQRTVITSPSPPVSRQTRVSIV